MSNSTKKTGMIIGGVCLVGLGLLIVGIVLLVVLFFFMPKSMPDVTGLLGLNKARDLGVKYSYADLQAGREITQVGFEDLPDTSKASIEFSGEKDISGEFSSEMITAMINGATYKYYPLTNTQVKIYPGGLIETSGNIDIAKLTKWAADLNADPQVIGQIDKYIGGIAANPSFYLKGTMSVTNNNIDLNVSEAQISVVKVDKQTIDQYQGQVADFVEERIANVPGMEIKSADFSSGKLVFDASYPAIEKTQK